MTKINQAPLSAKNEAQWRVYRIVLSIPFELGCIFFDVDRIRRMVILRGSTRELAVVFFQPAIPGSCHPF